MLFMNAKNVNQDTVCFFFCASLFCASPLFMMWKVVCALGIIVTLEKSQNFTVSIKYLFLDQY